MLPFVCVCTQDVAALESQPLLGFFLREEKSGPAEKLQFKLYHKNILYYIFRADDIPTAQRYTHMYTVSGLKEIHFLSRILSYEYI